VLDFGCGVGRLTLALAAHFDDVHGVDISAAMIERARAMADGVGNPPTYHHNRHPDLRDLDDDTFALVVTFIVLQHMPARDAMAYVREFVRILRPGGIAVFQMPEAHLRPTRLLDSRWLPPRTRNAAVRMKGRLLRRPYMEMHMVKRRRVVATVEDARGEVVEAAPDAIGGDFCRSIRYVIRKPKHPADNGT
jgi:SAM-dependent methyltransferase